MQERELIYDWNTRTPGFAWENARVELNDETLRDGLQSPSVTDPSIEDKKRLLHLMADLGIAAANIGLPGAGPRTRADTLELAREIVRAKLPLSANCAARTLATDIEPIAQIAQESGLAIEASTFIGSSPIRQYAEEWTLDEDGEGERGRSALRGGRRTLADVRDGRHDACDARDAASALYGAAIACGARRVCLADTVGHATPDGVRALVRFVREEIIAPSGESVKIDWHGHRDRGNGLANCFAAIEAGVDRVHGTALGIGERVGNAEMDLLLINLRLLGVHKHDLRKLPEYTALASRALGVAIPASYPVFGEDAFRTATGVHAAAIAKAHKKGDAWLADRIYSGVPAGDFGLSQRIDVGHVSGISNVRSWLDAHGHDSSDDLLCRYILDAAKQTTRTMRDDELSALVTEHKRRAVTA